MMVTISWDSRQIRQGGCIFVELVGIFMEMKASSWSWRQLRGHEGIFVELEATSWR